MSKECLVLLLDCGRSMSSSLSGSSTCLDACKEAARLMMQQKLLFTKQDEVALVLIGSDRTRNDMSSAGTDGYDHIEVVRPLGKPDLKLIEQIDEIEQQNSEGDVISALVVALDLIRVRVKKLKFQKRIFLLTDGGGPVFPDKRQTEQIVEFIKNENIRLNVIGVNFADDDDTDADAVKPGSSSSVRSSVQLSNERLLRDLCDRSGSSLFSIRTAMDIITQFRSKAVNQVTKYRGPLEIGPLAIPVFSYGATAMVNLPSLKKCPINEAGELAEGEIKQDRVYVNKTADQDVELSVDMLVKSYRFGRQLVPFNEADLALLKYDSERCLQVLAFVDRREINRFSFLSGVDCIVPEPGNSSAAVSLSAFIHAMADSKRVAIVRYVKRKGSAPLLGVLTPHREPDQGSECLYFNQLPFAEDVREFQFAGFKSNPQFKVNGEQLDAARNLVKSLSLMEALTDEAGEKCEALEPQRTINPALHHFYQCVQRRALDQSAPILSLDPAIARTQRPDPELYESAAPAIARFKQLFPLQKVEQKEGVGRKRHWRNMYDQAPEEDAEIAAAKKNHQSNQGDQEGIGPVGEPGQLGVDQLRGESVDFVSQMNPIKDFRSMLGRRDDPTVQSRAIEGMQTHIRTFIFTSVGATMFSRALECLAELRKGCLQCEEPNAFNSFITEIKAACGRRKDKEQFVLEMERQALWPIDSSEVPDSAVSPEEARTFYGASSAPTPVASIKPSDGEDLFDSLD